MQNLRVTLIQSDLEWQDAEKNLENLGEKIASLKGTTDLIVLPEMFNSGFSMQPERVAEKEGGITCQWLQDQAAASGAAICGSLAIETEQGFANRLMFVTPDGQQRFYDKRHLFRMGNEHEHYTQGHERLVFEYKGWRILPQICYDLRFPVWSRNRNDYDLVVYVANWPAPRRKAWRTLLHARAIENQCYCVGVNRVGSDGNGLDYSGDSLLVDYLGEPVIDHAVDKVFVETAQLNGEALNAFREKFPAWRDADQFQISP